jgi:hypothetical protein
MRLQGEKLMAEKARGIGVGIFGVILGVIEAVLASYIISFAINFNSMVNTLYGGYYQPAYLTGLYGAASSILMFGGVYVLIHAIKRIVDYTFLTYIASKQRMETTVSSSEP